MYKVSQETVLEAVRNVAATTDGQILLHALMLQCGYHSTPYKADAPLVAHSAAVKRGVYSQIRNMLEPDHIKAIEHNIEFVKSIDKRSKT